MNFKALKNNVLVSILAMSGLVLPGVYLRGAESNQSTKSGAAAVEYHQQTWTRDQGLPDNNVQALAQTRDGYLWLGTRLGLTRFDGLKFTVFNHVNTPLMTNDSIVALAADQDGSLWAATASGLLHRHLEGTFTRYTTHVGLCDNQIKSLCASHFGGVWAGSDQGLNRIHDNQVRRFTVSDGLRDNRIMCSYEDADGTAWVGTFSSYPIKEPEIQWRTHYGAGSSEPLFRTIRPIGADSMVRGYDGMLWIQQNSWLHGISSNGVAQVAVMRVPCPIPASFILADREGNLWLPAGKLGLDRFREGQFTRYPITPGLTNNDVQCMIEDREGNLWIGTSRDGLHCWQPRNILTYSTTNGLAHNNVWAILESHDGSMWLGTDGGVSHWISGRIVNYTEQEGLVKNGIRALAEDLAGDLWIGTGNGLDKLRAGVFSHHRFYGAQLDSDPDETSMNKIRVVLATRDGSLWVGLPLGLKRIHGDRDEFNAIQDGLPGNDVRALLEARDGSLWVGTAGGGVAQLCFGVPPLGGAAPSSSLVSASNFLIRCFTTTNGLSSNYAWAFHEDVEGTLWIGTERGLNRFKDGRFAVFTTREGLFDDLVNSILEDDRGYLWIGCDRGIYRVSRRELTAVAEGKATSVHSIVYDEADGLLSVETNGQKSQPSACKTRDGRLWFSTTNGVAVIDPRRLAGYEVSPLLVIEELRANGQIIFSNGNFDEIQLLTNAPNARAKIPCRQPPVVNHKSEISLPPGGANMLEIKYTANTFIAAKKARFRYRMLGLDTQWIEADTRRVAYFAGLRPGRYQFEVTASNHHGVWNEKPQVLALRLAPHFYETWAFYMICGTALGGFSGWRWRAWRKVQQLEKASALARQRERIARDLHDGLSASTTQIGLLTQRALRALSQPQQAAGHLRKVAAITDVISQSLADITWAIDRQDNTLGGFLGHLRRFAADYLAELSLQTQLDWPEEIPAITIAPELRYHLFLLVKEALNNVAKHARATRVSLAVALTESSLSIRLTDNGIGFDPAAAVTGHGLANMRQRVLDLGGQWSLSSHAGQGTQLSLQVPLLAPG